MAINFPSAPANGQVYSDSATGLSWVYNGSGWSANFTRSNYVAEAFTATAGQTTFTVSGGYLVGLLDVYQNGVKLVVGSDVTATNGSTIVLATGAQVGDTIEVRGLSTFSVGGTLPLTGGTISGTLSVTGNASAGNISTNIATITTGNITTLNATTAVITTGNITTINSGLLQNGNSNVTITANANVTISAVGGARITATSTGANVTGNLGVSGTITESSTVAIKENVRSLDVVIDKLMSLIPVMYDRIDGSSKDEPGLIAEQVYEVIPELVTLDDQGKPAAIKYSKVSIYVLKMLQDLKREIDSLKER